MSNNKNNKDFVRGFKESNDNAGDEKIAKNILVLTFKEKLDGYAYRSKNGKSNRINLFERGEAFMSFNEAHEYLIKKEQNTWENVSLAYRTFCSGNTGYPLSLLERYVEDYHTIEKLKRLRANRLYNLKRKEEKNVRNSD